MDSQKPEKESRVDFSLTIEDKDYSAFFSSRDINLSGNMDWYLACSLLLLMKKHVKSSTINGPVSPLLYSSIAKLQEILIDFDPTIGRVDFPGLFPEADPITGNDRVGLFFTGGVDSFFSLLKHADEITDLIYIHGYDSDPDDLILRKQVVEMLNRVAKHFAKNVIEIESDFRFLIHPIATWSRLSNGSALAAVGHLLSADLNKIYIAATHSTGILIPMGSHPELDPLWSSDQLQFTHDGTDFTRFEKIAYVMEHDIVRENLRVCLANPKGAYNCCVCYKCMRTMISLEILGILPLVKTFDQPLDLKRIRRMLLADMTTTVLFEENINELEQQGDNPALLKALYRVLNRPRWETKLRKKTSKLLQIR